MDLDHLEHAGFDPEAAAFEDGMDPEDLGYDVEEEDEEDFAGENCLRHWFLVEPMFSCTLMAAFEDGMDRATWGTTRRRRWTRRRKTLWVRLFRRNPPQTKPVSLE